MVEVEVEGRGRGVYTLPFSVLTHMSRHTCFIIPPHLPPYLLLNLFNLSSSESYDNNALY